MCLPGLTGEAVWALKSSQVWSDPTRSTPVRSSTDVPSFRVSAEVHPYKAAAQKRIRDA